MIGLVIVLDFDLRPCRNDRCSKQWTTNKEKGQKRSPVFIPRDDSER